MTFYKRVDDNHAAITAALRKIGCSVRSLATIGMGCPDAVVGFRGVNLLLEYKDGSKAPSARQLTADQVAFHEGWAGQVAVVDSPEAAVAYVLCTVGSPLEAA